MALNEAQMQNLLAAIQRRRAALEQELDLERAGASTATAPSEADEADTARDIAELKALEEAEARMVEGSYGKCVDCAAYIPYARLQAAPHAARCVACQARLEKGPRTIFA